MGIIGKWKNKMVSVLLVMALLSSLLSGCSSKASTKIDEKLELAVKYLSEQKYKEAILAYQEVIKIDSQNVAAYKGLSLAYVLQEQPGEAEKALQDGLKAVPNDDKLQLAIAGLMLDQGNSEKAEAIYKELINSDNPTLSSFQVYTYYLNRQGRTADAIALLESATAKNTQDYKLNSMLAELYFKNGDKEKALAALSKSINIQTDQSSTYELLIKMYRGRWDDLLALGDQYIRENQVKIGQLIKLTALYNMGDYANLLTQYESMPGEIKELPKARMLVSQAYLKSGKQDQAKATFELIKVGDLKDAGMLAAMAGYCLEAGLKDNARQSAMQGIAADETVVENYAAMYKSYVGENDALAKIWAYKYLLNSGLGYKEALSALGKAGMSIEDNTSGNLSKKEILRKIIFTQNQIEEIRSKNRTLCAQLGCYLDTQNNIAYTTWVFGDEVRNVWGWSPTPDQLYKNIVFRIHNPQIIPVSQLSIRDDTYGEESHIKEDANKLGVNQVVKAKDDYFVIYIEGNDYVNDLEQAGISINSIVFVDV